MTTLSLAPTPCDPAPQVLVLAAVPAGPGTVHVLADGALTDGLDLDALEALLPTLGFTGDLDAVVRLPASAVAPRPPAPTLLVVGAGRELERAQGDAAAQGDAVALGGDEAGVLRRLAGRAARELAGVDTAALALPADTPARAAALAQGVLLGAYAWAGKVPAPTPPLSRATVLTDLEDAAHGIRARAQVLAEGVALVRDLVNEPPNRLTPARLADQAASRGRQEALDVEVLDEAALEEGGFGGLLGVGQGSVNPPRLVRLEWAPDHAAAHVALVGKGITFDSGGLSLKPAASMPEMKSDMAGAATVLAAVTAAARLGLPVRVTAWLALAENLTGGGAQRPSDILTMYDGTTVEVTNTDAEGRLVMADALARAVQEHPDTVLDVATLTGAQLVALGERTAGVMGTPAVRDAVVDAARAAGEAFWPMPLPEHLGSVLESPYATLRNAATGTRWGGMLTAGLFLREFTAATPWAHLDIAGPAFNDGAPWGHTPTGGTGMGVATLVAFLEAQG